MVTLRCTRKLLARLPGMWVPESEAPPTTALGDYVATVVFARPAHIVIALSERTLLPVLLASAPGATLLARFPDRVAETLRAVGVRESAVVEEVEAMAPLRTGRTTADHRRVLGTLMDFVRMLPSYLERGESLLEALLHLAEAPCSVIGMETPKRETLRTLNAPR